MTFSISLSQSTKGRSSRSARALPTVDLPQPGIPMRMRFSFRLPRVFQASSALMAGTALPVKTLAAHRACSASMNSPPMLGIFKASACCISAVRAGL